MSTLFCWDREKQGVRELSPGIVSDPERHSGSPTIAGRRLCADLVADLAVAGCTTVLAEDYDLSPEQIAAAVEWNRRGRPVGKKRSVQL